MREHIKRAVYERALQREINCYNRQSNNWIKPKTVCVLSGHTGSGKTSFLLDYYRGKRYFYFSFEGLDEGNALKLFEKRVFEKCDVEVSGWEEAVKTVSNKYMRIIFDDISAISAYKEFKTAFYDNVFPKDIKNRPFVILIARPNEDLSGLADRYVKLKMDYVNIPHVMQLFPTVKKYDILGLCTVSGGIPDILAEYDVSMSFEENLCFFLRYDSAFCKFMPKLMSNYYRRPEVYHNILCAVANGNHRNSEIGKFTGFAYNKCNNYLSALVENGLLSEKKEKSKSGAEKTCYYVTNNYLHIWYRYVYHNQSLLRVGDEKLTDGIIKDIISTEIHRFHLEKAFLVASDRIRHHRKLSDYFGYGNAAEYSPKTVRRGKFEYTFDCILRKGNEAVFIKVLDAPDNNLQPAELKKIRKAAEIANMYYDSRILLFSKRRFSDYAASEAAKDEVLMLIEVDRLKF